MGLLGKRKEKVAESAAEYLEPDESIQAMVMTQVGETADELATKVAAHGARERSAAAGHLPQGAVGQPPKTNAVVHALAATERSVYAFPVPGLTSVGGVAMKAPLSEAEIRLDGKKKVVFAGTTYNVLFFAGKDARELVDYVEGNR
jgi:hypothetical protein